MQIYFCSDAIAVGVSTLMPERVRVCMWADVPAMGVTQLSGAAGSVAETSPTEEDARVVTPFRTFFRYFYAFLCIWILWNSEL